jgi:hypothetical protein
MECVLQLCTLLILKPWNKIKHHNAHFLFTLIFT